MKTTTIFLIAVFMAAQAFAAIPAGTVWEVRTTGADTNGGGFNPAVASPGTDESQADSGFAITVTLTGTGATGTADITFSATTHGPGNIINIASGTGCTPGWYHINSQTTGTATFDRSMGTAASECVGVIGGALASPGIVGSTGLVNGNIVYIKNGTYSITSASTNVANGCMSFTAGVVVVGYSSSRTPGNTGTKPILQLNVGSATIVGGNTGTFINIEFDGNSQTSSAVHSSAQTSRFINCNIKNMTAAGSGYGYNVYITGNAAAQMMSGCVYCVATANTATPFIGASAVYRNCISYANTGAAVDGFSASNVSNSVAYGNGRDGFRASGGGGHAWTNNVSESNGVTATGYGYLSTGSQVICINCASYGSAARSSGTMTDIGAITGSGSFFTDAANGDFSINSTSGRGALLKAAAWPATFQLGLTATYRDVGAAQHADPAAGGYYAFVGN